MSTDILIRSFWAAILSFVLAWAVFSRYDDEIGAENAEKRYVPYIFGALLPAFVACLTALGFAFYGAVPTAQMVLSLCFSIFLHISLYYALLMPLLPLLRRHISARSCAVLWLIPNWLYITEQNYMKLPEPLIVIRAPGGWVWALFGIWFTGFEASICQSASVCGRR